MLGSLFKKVSGLSLQLWYKFQTTVFDLKLTCNIVHTGNCSIWIFPVTRFVYISIKNLTSFEVVKMLINLGRVMSKYLILQKIRDKLYDQKLKNLVKFDQDQKLLISAFVQECLT